MASLIAPLAADNAGAPSGTAEIYSMGTSTLSSQVYSDANGETAVTTHTLSAYGSVVRYVTEPVDVVIKNVAGTTIKTFTHIDDARLVRVESPFLTGPNASAQTVAGGRTTVQAAWALFLESLGTTNANVLVGSTPQLIKNAIGGTTSVFYNVVSGYDADATGTTDSTSAIQAAINAAATDGGGIVYFPAGTYKITSALTITSGKVTLWGAGPSASVIKQYTSAISGWITCSANDITLFNIGFARNTTSMSGTALAVGTSTGVCAIRCNFAGFNGYHISGAAGGQARFSLCEFTITETGGRLVSGVATAPSTQFDTCRVTVSAVPSTALVVLSDVFLTSCTISVGAGTSDLFDTASVDTGAMVGGAIQVTAAVTVRTGANVTIAGVHLEAGSGAIQVECTESGCKLFDTGVTFTAANAAMASRDTRHLTTVVTGTTVALDTNKYGVHEISQTSGASLAFSISAVTLRDGAPLKIIYRNTTGGNITPTFSADFKTPTIALVGTGQMCVYNFVFADVGDFVLIGPAPTVITI